MSTTVLDNWREHRYIVAPEYLLDQNEILVVLTDVNYWAEHIDSLVEWCDNNHCVSQGMTVTMPDAATLTLFALRWS